MCDDVDFATSRRGGGGARFPAAVGSGILCLLCSLGFRRQFVEDLRVEGLCTLVDGSRRGHRRRDALDAVRVEGVLDAPPVMHARQELARQPELVKAHQAMGQDDRVPWDLVIGLKVGERGRQQRGEVFRVLVLGEEFDGNGWE